MELALLRKKNNSGRPSSEISSPASGPLPVEQYPGQLKSKQSPDMRPVGLPIVSNPLETVSEDHLPVGGFRVGISPPSDSGSFMTARDASQTSSSPPPSSSIFTFPEQTKPMTTTKIHMPEPVVFNPAGSTSSRASSLFTSTPTTQSEDEDHTGVDVQQQEYEGYDSPPPIDARLAEMRNERRYRMLLTHEHHSSRTSVKPFYYSLCLPVFRIVVLPLWSPSLVNVGSVGFLSKPKGEFVTLFSALRPLADAGAPRLGSIEGFGAVKLGSYTQQLRSATQRGLDRIAGILAFNKRSPDGSTQYVS